MILVGRRAAALWLLSPSGEGRVGTRQSWVGRSEVGALSAALSPLIYSG